MTLKSILHYYIFIILFISVVSAQDSNHDQSIVNESETIFPISGVLTKEGIYPLTFLVPISKFENRQCGVERYEVVSYDSTSLPPFENYIGWWICITKGEVIKKYDLENPYSYGKIKIIESQCDKSNFEMGME